jgi:prophage regulatory protein
MRLLSYEDLESKGIPYSRPHIWRLIKAGKFPKPVKIGAAKNCWVESEVDALIEARIAARDGSDPEAA